MRALYHRGRCQSLLESRRERLSELSDSSGTALADPHSDDSDDVFGTVSSRISRRRSWVDASRSQMTVMLCALRAVVNRLSRLFPPFRLGQPWGSFSSAPGKSAASNSVAVPSH